MRPLRRLVPAMLVSSLTLGSACAGDAGEPPAKTDEPPRESAPPPPPAPMPAVTAPTTDSEPVANAEGIVATLQVPTATGRSDLAAVIDNMKPGASMLLPMQVPALLGEQIGMDLGGARLDRPISLIVVDPIRNPKPLALLVEVGDMAKLSASAEQSGVTMRERDGRALLGPAAVVEQVAKLAFTDLASAPDHSELVIYPKTMLAALGPTLDEGIAEMTAAMASAPAGPAAAKMFDLYRDMLESMIAQTDRVVISVGASEASSDVFIRLYPTPGSKLARFTAAQTPSDHALLAKLSGAKSPLVLVSGTMQAGEAREALLDWTIELMQSMYQLELTAEQWRTVMNDWLAAFDGSFAMGIDMDLGKGWVDMRGVMGSTDAEAMRTAWRALAAVMTKTGGSNGMLGMEFAASFTQDALAHDGVTVDLFRTTIDLSSMPPQQQAAMAATGAADQAMHFAAFDQVAVMASADPEGATVKAAIDAARGKGAVLQPSPGLGAALDESKQNEESLVYYFDFDRIVPAKANGSNEVPFSAIVTGLGKRGEALSLRVSIRK